MNVIISYFVVKVKCLLLLFFHTLLIPASISCFSLSFSLLACWVHFTRTTPLVAAFDFTYRHYFLPFFIHLPAVLQRAGVGQPRHGLNLVDAALYFFINSPLNLIGPISRTHLTFGYVLSMSCFKRLLSSCGLFIA